MVMKGRSSTNFTALTYESSRSELKFIYRFSRGVVFTLDITRFLEAVPGEHLTYAQTMGSLN